MSRKKTYIDSGVLITAFQGIQAVSIRANRILYETFFSAVIHWATDLYQIIQDAYQIARTYGLAAMDALHVAAALQIKADELIATEKSTKPMHRVTEIQIISL